VRQSLESPSKAGSTAFSVSRVSPNPAPDSNSTQTLLINGSNFLSVAMVIAT